MAPPRDPSSDDDGLAELMTAYQRGSLQAFEQLHAAVAAPLLSYLASLCRDRAHAQDLLQEAFLQIHRSRRAYRAGLPVRPWVFTIARHVWMMDVRTRGRRPHASAELPDLPVPADVDGLAARDVLVLVRQRQTFQRLDADRLDRPPLAGTRCLEVRDRALEIIELIGNAAQDQLPEGQSGFQIMLGRELDRIIGGERRIIEIALNPVRRREPKQPKDGGGVDPSGIRVELLPTFVGCPAIDVMQLQIGERLRAMEIADEVRVELRFTPPWTSDRISPEGREKLRVSGFAPPALIGPSFDGAELQVLLGVATCPYCGSRNTTLDNPFGPTLCRAIFHCDDCRQPFEQFKTIIDEELSQG